MREEERFIELQQALQRARAERIKTVATSTSTGAGREITPPISPTRSPGAGLPVPPPGEDPPEDRGAALVGTSTPTIEKDFFSDELRGYRLLKAARLGVQERQHILTLTANSTRFEEVRRALRTLYADDKNHDDAGARNFRSRRTVWWAEGDEWNEGHEDDGSSQWLDDWEAADEGTWADEVQTEEAYYGEWYEDWSWEDPTSPEEMGKDDTSDLGSIPEKERYEEAYTLHQEAAKTLQEARQAVAKVRAARGYYDTSGLKGSGRGYRQHGKGKSKGASKGKGQFRPCFICGSRSHTYEKCPDRHSPHGGLTKSESQWFPKRKRPW